MENQKELQKKEKHRCKVCGSLFGYFKVTDGSWQCRACGNLDKGVNSNG